MPRQSENICTSKPFLCDLFRQFICKMQTHLFGSLAFFRLNLTNFDKERLVLLLFTEPIARRLLLLQNVNLIIRTVFKSMLMEVQMLIIEQLFMCANTTRKNSHKNIRTNSTKIATLYQHGKQESTPVMSQSPININFLNTHWRQFFSDSVHALTV